MGKVSQKSLTLTKRIGLKGLRFFPITEQKNQKGSKL